MDFYKVTRLSISSQSCKSNESSVCSTIDSPYHTFLKSQVIVLETIFRLPVVILHSSTCCQAFNALMELRGGSGGDRGSGHVHLFWTEIQRSKVMLKKPQ